MTRRIAFHPLAEQELNEAASYYDTASAELGTAFLEEVEHAVKQILKHPEAAPLMNRVVRRKLVRRFPYSVMYSVPTTRSGYWPLPTRNGVLFTGVVASDDHRGQMTKG